MAGLTVTEKEHWKTRIDSRIARRIETLSAEDPGLLERIKEEARGLAVASLGLAELQAEAQEIELQQEALSERETAVHRAMLARVRGVPVDAVTVSCGGYVERNPVNAAIERRRAVHEKELLAEHDLGRRILALRREREGLIDTVWLATSSAAIRELWTKVGQLLTDQPTQLERDALAIEPESVS